MEKYGSWDLEIKALPIKRVKWRVIQTKIRGSEKFMQLQTETSKLQRCLGVRMAQW